MGTFSAKNRSRRLWSVVEGRRVNQSSAAGVLRVCLWSSTLCVCVISREHGDLSHVSILSMFTAPHTYKLFTTVHRGALLLAVFDGMIPTKLVQIRSIIFYYILCGNIGYLCVCVCEYILKRHLLLSWQLNFQQPLLWSLVSHDPSEIILVCWFGAQLLLVLSHK